MIRCISACTSAPSSMASPATHLRLRKPLLRPALTLGLLCTAPAALAYNYQNGDLRIALDTRLSEGLALRTDAPDPLLIALSKGGQAYSANADDGDLNYGRGSIVSATSQITSALTVDYHDYGIFGRFNYAFDPKLQQQNYFNPDYFGPGHQYPDAIRLDRNRQIQDHVGSDGTVLDLYAYANIPIQHHTLSIKVGRQVVHWGETTLFFNGLSGLIALDANKARGPSAELDEIEQPAAQIRAQFDFTSHINVDGWYQLKWERTLADDSGTFFETTDYVADGGVAGNIDFGRATEYAAPGSSCVRVPVGISCVPYGGSIPRDTGLDRKPGNSGQGGVAVNFALSQLGGLQLSLYAANYHSRLPVYSSLSAAAGNVDASTARVLAEYPKDIHLYGTSFNVLLPGGISLQGEYSYTGRTNRSNSTTSNKASPTSARRRS